MQPSETSFISKRLRIPRQAAVRERDALTRRFYEINATTYAEATWRLSMDELLSNFTARLPSGATVVDLGCGAGRDLKSLADRGFFAVGLDVAAPLAHIARHRSDCPVVIGDLRHLPLASERFDGAWASASLLHLGREDIGQALAEICRILKPDGLLFASMKAGRGERADERGRWFSYYGVDEWRSLLEDAGLAPILLESSVQSTGTPAPVPTAWITSIARRDS
ncbi:MAG: class I SAM-dependent methyltransferase [Ideonella sp.]|nr:class I SAM-dependent methyltransferase [Ideonella sp.]